MFWTSASLLLAGEWQRLIWRLGPFQREAERYITFQQALNALRVCSLQSCLFALHPKLARMASKVFTIVCHRLPCKDGVNLWHIDYGIPCLALPPWRSQRFLGANVSRTAGFAPHPVKAERAGIFDWSWVEWREIAERLPKSSKLQGKLPPHVLKFVIGLLARSFMWPMHLHRVYYWRISYCDFEKASPKHAP